ncbi:MAG: adenylate/guanylate cyclase domain-containing protein [Actinobacteria bacterium]|nr:adenylate/guanylate cyclase domain-containing protein [Actinomycetota bacterium]
MLDGWVMPLEARWELPVVASALKRLSSFARVISFDKRGVGLSDRVAFAFGSTLEEWTDDVATVMRAVGSERAVVFGHHDGGWPAMLFAAAHPERASHLVLVNTTARIARDEENQWGIPPDLFGSPADLIGTYGAAQGMVLVPDELRAWWSRARRHQASPSTFVSLMELQWQVDLRWVLPTINLPTLVVHSAENTFWRVGHGRYLAEHIDGATLVEVPGTDHHWQLGDTGPVVEEVEAFVTGTRPAPVSDRVLATVLFTDIVGSTPRVTAMGDRPWGDLLDRYEAAVRNEITRHKGREIFTKGDEFLVTFDGPARAVRCAQAIAETAASFDLAVRSGVHTGEVELRGDDVAGIAVHIGARVMSAAQPGEILVSRTVTDLTAGSGLRFEDRGQHALKGVENEWQLFAVM